MRRGIHVKMNNKRRLILMMLKRERDDIYLRGLDDVKTEPLAAGHIAPC